MPHEYEKVIKALRATANAPMESMCESALGLGIVGGPLTDSVAEGKKSARVAVRILNGERAGDIHVPAQIISTSIYDWRELRRWNISEDRLPPGSVIKFREPTMWARYRNWMIAGVSALVIQGVLIGALVANLAKRRKAERSFRESEGRMKLVTDAGDLRLWEWDSATDQVWVGGPLVERIGPRDTGPFHFKDLFQTVHPDDRNGVDLALEKCLTGDGQFENVHRRILLDGKVIWVAVRGRVEFDHTRKPLRMRGISMDITARKEAENRARESEDRIKLAASAAQLGMWEWDLATNRLWVDERAGERIGATNGESDYSRFWRAVHRDDRPGVAQALAKAIRGDGKYESVHRRVLADGEVRWIAARGQVEFNAERKPVRMRGVGMDITARKLAEDQARASAAEAQLLQQELAHASRVWTLGELAGSLAHQLNQPLAAVVSNAEAAQRFMDDLAGNEEELRETLKDICVDALRASETIAGMRTMLKKEPAPMARQDLNRAVREVLEILSSELTSRHVTTVLQLDPNLPSVTGHGVQLRQVLLNLMMNACDAMSGGATDRRQLTVESKRADMDKVEISITDTGPGFPEESLPHVFEPFRTTRANGLGLGLAICQSIIRTHDGRLTAANGQDGGAMLRFTLPIQNSVTHE